MTDHFEIPYLAALRQAQSGLTAAELNALDLNAYARATGRPTPAEAARAALDAQYEASQSPGTDSVSAREAVQANADAPQGRTLEELALTNNEAFLAWRANRTRGGEGRGIFDGVSSQSQAYTDAVRAQSGRAAFSNQNVTEAPRIERVFVQDSPVSGRTMGYR